MIHLDILTLLYGGAIGLILIGILGLATADHLLRLVLALSLAEAGGNLLLILVGYRGDALAPILGFGPAGAPMVDPIPQALVLTAIVIGVGVQALAIALLVRIHRRYGTLDIRSLKEHLERDLAAEQGLPPPSRDAPAGGRPLSPVPPRPQIRESERC